MTDGRAGRNDQYQKVRLTVHPGRNLTTVAVTCTRSVAGRDVVNLVFRGTLADTVPYPNALELVDLLERAVAEVKRGQ